MARTLATRLILAFAVTATIALPTFHQLPRAAADVPDDPAPVCDGTTQDGTGAVTTPTTGSIVFAGAYLSHYQAGEPVSMYNNLGERAFTDAGNPAVADRVPTCALRRIGGVPVATWLYCTDETLSACNSSPTLVDDQENLRLTADDREQIAVLLEAAQGTAQEATSRARAIVQLQVWCISEGVAPGAEMTAARTYFNSNNRLPPGDDLTATESLCDPRPTVPADPTVGVTAGSASVANGGTATYDVVSNRAGEITLSTSSGALSLCPSDTSGATLAGVVLTTTSAGVPVQLCATTPAVGTQTVTARLDYSSTDGLWAWTGDVGCQHFAGYRGRVDAVTADAAVDVQAAATTTTTTSTVPASTSTSTTTTTVAGNGGGSAGTVPTTTAAIRPTSSGRTPSQLAATGRDGIVGQLLIASGVAILGFGLLRLRRR